MSPDAKPVHVFATSAIRDLLPEADRQLTATFRWSYFPHRRPAPCAPNPIGRSFGDAKSQNIRKSGWYL